MNANGTHTKLPIFETMPFIAALAAIGGYLNAYSFITFGSFVSLHTGNMIKLGMALFQTNWADALAVFIPITGNITGAFLAEVLKRRQNGKPAYAWQKASLAVELFALLCIGIIPNKLSAVFACWLLSVCAGFQLSNFRSCEGAVFNTTICTGNLRTVGQYLCTALLSRSKENTRKFLRFSGAVFSLPAGAGIGVIATKYLGGQSIWICSAALTLLFVVVMKKAHEVDSVA